MDFAINGSVASVWRWPSILGGRESERVYVVVGAYMEVVEAGILAAAVKNRRLWCLSWTPVCLNFDGHFFMFRITYYK